MVNISFYLVVCHSILPQNIDLRAYKRFIAMLCVENAGKFAVSYADCFLDHCLSGCLLNVYIHKAVSTYHKYKIVGHKKLIS